MKKYAIIKLGGKQYKVTEGAKIKVERQEKLNFDVLFYSDGKSVEIGEPTLKGIQVSAKIVNEEKAPKIRVTRFKAKSRYNKTKGHSQPISVVEIGKITKGSAKKSVKKTPVKKTTKITKKKEVEK